MCVDTLHKGDNDDDDDDDDNNIFRAIFGTCQNGSPSPIHAYYTYKPLSLLNNLYLTLSKYLPKFI
jgi:hypothetical protein